MNKLTTELKIPFALALERVIAALQAQELVVLQESEAHLAGEAKLNIEGRPYRILAAYGYSALAHRALTLDANAGLAFSCHIVVREDENGHTTVVLMDPAASLAAAGNALAGELTEESRLKLSAAVQALESAGAP